ncbi:NifU family protein [Yunchengibacter salinarum]|uniref:NifU family protein n=1 Tax=Yunchengibacter salinarum TaxID=3133399 RepID=UPI0035B589A6
MFIETEPTPNPETLKFLPGRTVMEKGTLHIERADAADGSPLAQALFGVSGVEGVFLGEDFVSVTKADSADWDSLKADVLAAMMSFFASGAPVVHEGVVETGDTGGFDDDEADSDIIVQIRQLLDEKVRPAVAQDGGDVVYHGFKEGVVYLKMQGACSGCPSSTATLQHGIANLLKYYVPEVTDVRPVA